MIYLEQNSQFEVFSTVSLDLNGSLAGKSEFGEDIVSEAGSDSSGIFLRTMVAKSTRTFISNFFILQPKKVLAIRYSRDNNCKTYNYHKVGIDNF